MAVKRLRLREFMERKAQEEGHPISANSIAQAIGVSHNTIIKYMDAEYSEPTYSFVMKLCDYFGCEHDEMVVMEESEPDCMAVA